MEGITPKITTKKPIIISNERMQVMEGTRRSSLTDRNRDLQFRNPSLDSKRRESVEKSLREITARTNKNPNEGHHVKKVTFDKDTKASSLTFAGEKELRQLKQRLEDQAEEIKTQNQKIKQLEEELERKNTIINEQEVKIAQQSKKEKVHKWREDLEIDHLVPRLRLWLQVFPGKDLQEYLFGEKTEISKDDFFATLIDKLHIDKIDDTLLLANYPKFSKNEQFFPLNIFPESFRNYFFPGETTKVQTSKVLEKIIEIAGPYRSFDDSDFAKLKEVFEKVEESKKNQLIEKLNMIINNGKSDHMTSTNFSLFLQTFDIDFDKRAFIILLLRKSQSISVVSTFALKTVMFEILGYGEKPQKEEMLKKKDSGEFISQTSFANNIRKIMVTYKVAQAFKAKKSKPVEKESLRSTKTMKQKANVPKHHDLSEIKQKIRMFIRGETVSDGGERDYFGQKISEMYVLLLVNYL